MISGSALVSGLVTLVVIGLIFWLLLWFIDYAGIPQPFNKVAKVVLALVAVVFLINFLLGLSGSPLFKF